MATNMNMDEKERNCLAVLTQAVNVLHEMKTFEKEMSLKAKMLFLQGNKRRNRFYSKMDYALILKLINEGHNLFDVGIETESSMNNIATTRINSYKDYFRTMYETTWEHHDQLMECVNELWELKYPELAKCLKDRACKLYNLAHSLKRDLERYDGISWNPLGIYPREDKLHKKYKKKEKMGQYHYKKKHHK